MLALLPALLERVLPAAALVVTLLFAGCSRDGGAHVVTAEFQDETPDGVARQQETLRLVLDRPLPPGLALSTVKVRVKPPVDSNFEVLPGSSPRELRVKIQTGTPAFRFQGIHGKDPDSTGIGLDFGDGVREWVDLSLPVSLPVLERVVWEDRYPPDGDFIVDQGDVLHLVFDRPVKLAAEDEEQRVLVPQDVLLSKPNSDRLDDGEFHARFEPGLNGREVLIVLGSGPVLTVAGTLPADPRTIERFKASSPSGLALNGTRLLPMRKITDARGGPGAVSSGEVDIEFPEGFLFPEKKLGQDFPAPGHRIFHTVTPIASGRALVAGGASAQTREALDQVLIYDPVLGESKPPQAFRLAEQKLPHPTQSHTATALAGPDETFGTFDDAVIVAGGSDGMRSLSDLTLLTPREDGGVDVEPLPEGLRVPRAEHAAVAVGPNELLVDGGRKSDPDGPGGLVECAELIVLTFGEGSKARVGHHHVFSTLARSFHTLTLLPQADAGDVYVLAVGGFGRARQQLAEIHDLGKTIDGASAFCSTDSAAVLASPILINVTSPEKSFELPTDFLFPLVRWGHAAIPVEADDTGGGPPRSRLVLIAGGAIRHPLRGFDGARTLWERKQREQNLLDLRPPQEHEASTPLLFRFDSAAPQESRFEMLRRTATDPGQVPDRVYFAAARVPERGIVISGGELRDGQCLSSVEVFLADELRSAELAMPLLTPRSRHQAYVVRRGARASLILIGGVPGPGAQGNFSAVEEVPIK